MIRRGLKVFAEVMVEALQGDRSEEEFDGTVSDYIPPASHEEGAGGVFLEDVF